MPEAVSGLSRDSQPVRPIGPEAPHGPPKLGGFPALPRAAAPSTYITVPATDDFLANGLALQDAVNQRYATDQGYANVTFHLEAGFYTLTAPLHLEPGFSLQGAGMLATMIQCDCANQSAPATIVFGAEGAGLDQGISNLTITGSDNPPLFGYVSNFFVLDHVRLSSGYSGPSLMPVAAANGSTINLVSPNAQYHIVDSILGHITFATQLAEKPSSASAILSTEIEPAFAGEHGPALCAADYSLAKSRLLSADCH